MFKKKDDTAVITAPKRPRKKMKPWKVVAVLVIVLLIVYFAVGAMTKGSGEMLPAVATAEVTKGDITATLDTSGTIVSEETRVYASPVNAQVGEVPVEVGQNVKKGEYLLTYDTSSLQKSYDIAALQAKADEANGNDSLAKSSESATDLAASNSDIHTLQEQINAVNAEISSLQAQAADNEKSSNTNASRQAEAAELKASIESINAQVTALEEKILANAQNTEAVDASDQDKQKIDDLKKEKKELEKKLSKLEKKIKDSADLANHMVNIQSELTKKNNQLADLQSKLGEAQSKNASAEAGILSDAAKANISYNRQASQLTLEQTADDLSTAKAGVKADFDGIITEVAVSPGTIAAEGTPLITLASSENMCVEIPVSKYNLENIRLDQDAVITFQEKEYKGKVSYISKIAQKGDTGGAMVTIKVSISNPDDALIIGLDAKVSVLLGIQADTFIVPIASVNADTQGDFVFVVEEGTVVKKYVTPGMASKEEIEVKSGLNAGEKVITSVDSSIYEGMMVTEAVPEDAQVVTSTEE
ncbi:MAG: efflux RND transporter periplasmic adaptor subunit [Roseburia sp.]|nr:efflux RND transporter periplasmic adaptor subunit [Roseburia sp.]